MRFIVMVIMNLYSQAQPASVVAVPAGALIGTVGGGIRAALCLGL